MSNKLGERIIIFCMSCSCTPAMKGCIQTKMEEFVVVLNKFKAENCLEVDTQGLDRLVTRGGRCVFSDARRLDLRSYIYLRVTFLSFRYLYTYDL